MFGHYGWRRVIFNLASMSGQPSKDHTPLSSHLGLERPLAFAFEGRCAFLWVWTVWLR